MTNHRLNSGELDALISLLTRNLPVLRWFNDGRNVPVEAAIKKLELQRDLLGRDALIAADHE